MKELTLQCYTPEEQEPDVGDICLLKLEGDEDQSFAVGVYVGDGVWTDRLADDTDYHRNEVETWALLGQQSFVWIE